MSLPRKERDMKEYRVSGKMQGSTRWDYMGKWKGEYTTADFEKFLDNTKHYTGLRVKDAETGKIVFEKVKGEA